MLTDEAVMREAALSASSGGCMTVEMSIETDDFKVAADFFDGKSVAFGEWIGGPDGVRVQFKPPMMRRSFDAAPVVLGAVLSIPAGVASAVVAHWLIEKMGQRTRRVTIGKRSTTRITRDEIEHIVEEMFEAEETD